MDKKRRLRELEVKLLEKQVELVELRTKSFGLWWRDKLDKMRVK